MNNDYYLSNYNEITQMYFIMIIILRGNNKNNNNNVGFTYYKTIA